ncbi:MAG TPA: hypothetical protein VGF85_13155 [Opitutaceae bacterium]|jgi:hypothetical protein
MKPLPLLLTLGLLCLAPSVLGQAPALVRQSPFAGDALAGSKAESAALELRGIISGAGETRYWIYDRTSKTGAWSAVGEPGLPFLVRAGDPGQDSATVEKDGRVALLQLRSAKVLPESPETAATPPNSADAAAQTYVMTRRLPGEPRAPRSHPGN